MQTYNQTAENQTLKIDATVTETKVIKKEVSIPYYFKTDLDRVCKIVSNNHFILVNTSKNYWSIETYPVKSWETKIANGTPITEDEYNYAFQKAVDFIQALNQNDDTPTEQDENVQIDQMLYNQY